MEWLKLSSSSSTSKLLERHDVEGQLQLLNKLYSKAQSSVSLEQLLRKHPSCLSAVTDLLSCSSVDVQEQAARVLGCFALVRSVYAERVTETSGAVEGLAARLRSSTAAVQRAAAGTFTALAQKCPVHLGRARGGMNGLVALLECSDPGMQQGAASTLEYLCRMRFADTIAAEPGAIKGLAALVSSSVTDAQLAAVSALKALVLESPASRQPVSQEPGAIQGLVVLLSSGRAEAQVAAARALTHLAGTCSAGGEPVGQEPGFIKGLAAMLSSSEAYVQLAAAKALEVLVARPANCQHVGQEPGVIAGLAPLLSSSRANIQYVAAKVLGYLALASPANSKAMGQDPRVVMRLEALVSYHYNVPKHVAWAAGFAMAAAAQGSSMFQRAFDTNSNAVWKSFAHVAGECDWAQLEVADLLYRLAASSTALKQSMADSEDLQGLLVSIQQQLQRPSGNNARGAETLAETIQLLTHGKTVYTQVLAYVDNRPQHACRGRHTQYVACRLHGMKCKQRM